MASGGTSGEWLLSCHCFGLLGCAGQCQVRVCALGPDGTELQTRDRNLSVGKEALGGQPEASRVFLLFSVGRPGEERETGAEKRISLQGRPQDGPRSAQAGASRTGRWRSSRMPSEGQRHSKLINLASLISRSEDEGTRALMFTLTSPSWDEESRL